MTGEGGAVVGSVPLASAAGGLGHQRQRDGLYPQISVPVKAGFKAGKEPLSLLSQPIEPSGLAVAGPKDLCLGVSALVLWVPAPGVVWPQTRTERLRGLGAMGGLGRNFKTGLFL